MPVLHYGCNQHTSVKLYQDPVKTNSDPPHLPTGLKNLPGHLLRRDPHLCVTSLIALLPKIYCVARVLPYAMLMDSQLHETPEVGNGQKQTESGRHFIGIGQHPGADGYLGSSREPIGGNEIKSRGNS
jgi:hypothetical protein